MKVRRRRQRTVTLAQVHGLWADALREAIGDRSMQSVASGAGISADHLWNILAGRRRLTVEVQWRLAGALGRKPGELWVWPDVVPVVEDAA